MSEKYNEDFDASIPSENEISTNEESAELSTRQSLNENFSLTMEKTVSPEEAHEVLETGEQSTALDILMSSIAKDTGETFTVDKLSEGGPQADEAVMGFFDRHPKAAKYLKVLTLSTALASPASAHADFTQDVVRAIVQGQLQQTSQVARGAQSARQQEEYRDIQLQQQRMGAAAAKERIHENFEQRRADINHQEEMKKITDPRTRQMAEMNYQERRALENADRQEREQERRWVEQSQIANAHAKIRIDQGVQNTQLGTSEQIIQQGANAFLQQILMKR